MTTQIQRRRGTTAQHSTFTGAVGEITVDTDKEVLVVHDGTQAGGYPQMRENGSNSALALGSAATPSLKFTGDTNTGIYSPGADQVSVATGGTERLRIDSTGQIEAVSLGTAEAPAYTWVGDPNTGIYSPGADQVAISTNGSGRLFVDASGNIDFTAAGLKVTTGRNISATAANSTICIFGGDITTNTGANIELYGGSHATLANLMILDAGEHRFRSADGSSERMRLTSDGRLGLGTSSPDAALTAVGSATISSQVNVAARIGPNVTSDLLIGSINGNTPFIASQGAYPLALRTNATTALTIDSSQRVGIGTTSPDESLEVVGNIKLSQTSTQLIFEDSDSANLTINRFQSYDGALIADVDPSNNGSVSSTFRVNVDGTERARIDSSGRLLVGTSSSRTVAAIAAREQIETTSYLGLSVVNNTADNGGGGIVIGKSRSASIGGVTSLVDGDEVGNLYFAAADGVDLDSIAGAVRCFIDGTPGSNDTPGRLVFSVTADGSASPTEAMRINNAGELLVGYTTDNGAYKLQVNSQIFATSATIATSDGRYKENVASLGGCLDLVKALRPVSFTWKPQEDITRIDDDGNEVLVREGHNFPEGTQVGFIAQEVQEVLADKPWLGSVIKENVRPAVKDNEGNELAPEEQFYGIAEGNLIAVLTNALQEAVGRIEALEAEVAALKS